MRTTAIVPCAYDDATAVARTLDTFCDRVFTTQTLGLGPAYLEAWANLDFDDLALHVDVGHDPHDARDVLDEMLDSDADLVIGSRFCPGGTHAGDWKRRITSKAAAYACNLVTFYNVADWTSGLRCYSPRARRILADYPYTTTGHAWQIESLWVALRAGLRVHEVPIHYVAGNSSLSRARVAEAVKLWNTMLTAPPSHWDRYSARLPSTSTDTSPKLPHSESS